MTAITPFLWYDSEAEQAVERYVSLFPDSRVDSVARTPDGAVLVVEFTLLGRPYRAMNGGPAGPPALRRRLVPGRRRHAGGARPGLGRAARGRDAEPLRVARRPVGRDLAGHPVDDGRADGGSGDPDANARVYEAMMQMVKLDIPTLQAAAAGR